MTFQGLWAVSYLMDVYGYSRVQAGGVLMLMPIGFIIGAPLTGFLSDRLNVSRKVILQWSLGIGVICWSIFVIGGGKPDVFLIAPLFFISMIIALICTFPLKTPNGKAT